MPLASKNRLNDRRPGGGASNDGHGGSMHSLLVSRHGAHPSASYGAPARQLWGPSLGPPGDGAAAGEVATRPTAALMEVAMAFREIRVYEIKEVLRLWLRGTGTRKIAVLVDLDRKPVQRYIAAAAGAGLEKGTAEEALDDVVMAQVCERARPRRRDGHGDTWSTLAANHGQLKAWLVDGGLTAVKATELLARKGVVVPERTLQRYALKVLGGA